MTTRQILPTRRPSITQKIKIGNRRTVYLSTDSASQPLEVFIRVRGTDLSAEITALYDCLARLVSLALQYGVPLDAIGQHLLSVLPDASNPPAKE